MPTIQTVPEGYCDLPLGVSVQIETWGDTSYVTICARLHRNRRFTLPHSYSAKHYTVGMIMADSDFLKYLARYR